MIGLILAIAAVVAFSIMVFVVSQHASTSPHSGSHSQSRKYFLATHGDNMTDYFEWPILATRMMIAPPEHIAPFTVKTTRDYCTILLDDVEVALCCVGMGGPFGALTEEGEAAERAGGQILERLRQLNVRLKAEQDAVQAEKNLESDAY
jgi:hypothetical protein